MDQNSLDKFAESLGIKYSVLDNLSAGKNAYNGRIEITNNSDIALKNGNWGIYFCHIRMMEPDHLPESASYIYKDIKLRVTHVNGCLFALEPVEGFKPLTQGESLTVNFKAQYHSVAKTDVFPNWYIHSEGLKPRLIKSTVGEHLDFITGFDKPEKWKRFDYQLPNGVRRYDCYDPWTPEVRFEQNEMENIKPEAKLLVPTPFKMTVKSLDQVNIQESDWAVWSHDKFKFEANLLADMLGLKLLHLDEPEAISRQKTIFVRCGLVDVAEAKGNKEAYTVEVDSNSIQLQAPTSAGIIYACQTLYNLRDSQALVPMVSIIDFPRFSYRGMHLDVSRNFHTKEEVLHLLQVMAMYKLNTLHFHLSDDEGWRLEIPGLPELTEVGGRRGHDLKEETCLLPVLGSGPSSDTSPGSGFYTTHDYREIVQFAASHNIEVIPEIDMPGHCHAAIMAMTSRYHRLIKEGRPESEARQYLLTDLENQSNVQSVQMFSDNVLDPGLESTFTFIEKVVKEVKAMHEDISPLRVFHLGGDEVPYEAWLDSPKCQTLILAGTVETVTDIMSYFIRRVGKIIHSHGLDVGAWQDGIVVKKTHVLNRSDFDNDTVMVCAWKNVWETGMASDSVKLANAGYKVVMSQATHLYFDHPYEPDPDERGLYWSGRHLDTRKVFSFMPQHLYDNADVKVTGEKFTEEELKNLSLGGKNTLEKPENIIGMQGHLWTELVRTPNQLQEMIIPRLIALAERAWHRASWEDEIDQTKREAQRRKDWADFSATLGGRELPRLEDRKTVYYLPPPGARVTKSEIGRELRANCAYQGLPMYFSIDGGATWTQYTQPVELHDKVTSIKLVTRSFDGTRSSRTVEIVVS